MPGMFRVVPNKQHERKEEIADGLRFPEVDVFFL